MPIANAIKTDNIFETRKFLQKYEKKFRVKSVELRVV